MPDPCQHPPPSTCLPHRGHLLLLCQTLRQDQAALRKQLASLQADQAQLALERSAMLQEQEAGRREQELRRQAGRRLEAELEGAQQRVTELEQQQATRAEQQGRLEGQAGELTVGGGRGGWRSWRSEGSGRGAHMVGRVTLMVGTRQGYSHGRH